MPHRALRSVIVAVRRRLWRSEFLAAARLALWTTGASMLLAAAVHVALLPVRMDVVLMLASLLWASLLARAAWRRPSDGACALWADRHADGTSAFTTWLETARRTPDAARAPAVARLEQWASARAPHSLRLVEQMPDGVRLLPALLVSLACAAVAALVLTLPGPAGSSRLAASHIATVVERNPPQAERVIADELAGELTKSPAGATPSRAPDRSAGSAPATRIPDRAARTDAAAAGPAPASTPGREASAEPSGARAAADAPASSTGGPAAVPASGREAGDSRDLRSDPGTSLAAGSETAATVRTTVAHPGTSDARADPSESGRFDDDALAPRPGAEEVASAAPATPPAADPGAIELGPARAAYVRAWTKAIERRR